MTNINPSELYIRIAHSLQEQLMVTKFTEYQRRMVDLIYRLSFACGRKTAYIPHQKDFELVGVHEVHVKAHLYVLIRDGVIFRDGCYYAFNLNFKEWHIGRAFTYSPEKFKELVRLNLSTPDKDILTESVSLTENVSRHLGQLTDSVSPTDPQTYLKGKSPVPELASAKETTALPPIEDIDKYNHMVVEGFLEILPRVSGWGFDKVDDKLWIADLLRDFPETQLSEVKACADYYSSKEAADKGIWKSRFRRWMKREREYHKDKGEGNGKGNKGTGQQGKVRVAGSRPKEDYGENKPWIEK